MNEIPLVSVVVITYNSSKYILDTLDSIKNQTYPNVELVVSDDCSTDNTEDIVNSWLKENNNYFFYSKFIKSPTNKGISSNCNQGVRNSTGVWIKLIAGDDKLTPNAIDVYTKYVREHVNAVFLCCKLRMFGDEDSYVKDVESYYEKSFYPKMKLSHDRQYSELLRSLYIPGPGVFYLKRLWDDVGGYDEKYKYCEEHPFYLRIVKNYNIDFIEEYLVFYRVYRGSVCRSEKKVPLVYEGTKQFFKDTLFPRLIKKGDLFFAIDKYMAFSEMDAYYYNHPLKLRLVKLLRLFSPYRWYCKLFKK